MRIQAIVSSISNLDIAKKLSEMPNELKTEFNQLAIDAVIESASKAGCVVYKYIKFGFT